MKLRENSTDSLKPLLLESAGSPTTGVQRTLFGIPVYLNSKLSTSETKGTASNASSVYVYQADQIVAVRREEARIEVDRSIYFDRDMTAIRGVVRWDMVVPNPKAVVRIDGVVPAV
jgi:HK97 family phage major capsid protein